METRQAGLLPMGPGRLRQVFRGAGVRELADRHRAGRTAGGATYFAEVDWRLEDPLRTFRSQPLRLTMQMLLRRHWDGGPIQDRDVSG